MRKVKTWMLGMALATGLAASAAQAGELRSVGITLGTLGNPFFVVVVKGAEAAARKINPQVKITSLGAEYDLGRQFSQIDNFIASGVDMIVINAVDPNAIAPAVEKARKKGIVVVAVGDAASGADAAVMINNLQAGQRACQVIVDRLGAKGGDVLIVNGPQVSAVVARVKGCESVLSQHPQLHVLSSDQDAHGSRDGGLSVGQSLLTRFSHVDAIFAINDPTAIGVSLAAKQLHRRELFITSVDGSPDIEAALKDPSTLIVASASQDPYVMASLCVEVGNEILHGKRPEPSTQMMDSLLLTKDNLASYQGWTTPR